MSLHQLLCASAQRWAATALDAYVGEPPDLDFAVHHMAVAVEHLSKAYLCSVSDVLLVDKTSDLDDLLILAGHQGRTTRQRSDVKTISAATAWNRTATLLGRKPAGSSTDLQSLRAARNAIAHLGLGVAPDDVRPLIADGIAYLNDLLTELEQSTATFWGVHDPLTARLLVETVTYRQLRYENKLRAAQERFERRFGKWPDAQRAELTATLSLIPGLFGFLVETVCPACGTTGPVEGTNYTRANGTSLRVWSEPTNFSCRRCGLTLQGDELELAGIAGFFLDDREVDGSVWWPSDSNDLTRLPEWDADHDL